MRNYVKLIYATMRVTSTPPGFLQDWGFVGTDLDDLNDRAFEIFNTAYNFSDYQFVLLEQREVWFALSHDNICDALNRADAYAPYLLGMREFFTGPAADYITFETPRRKERRKFRLVPIRR